ncbi:MAG: peptidase S46 [Bacteroidetes bacterium GWF2_42_66]|nr:MAG: peptidase S46 [Bacteroidetes bacterium GWA2_42_15]OFY02121.1 MAG: peptidase S46 [Bacteroidetes bacterium GWE2_42_39]OFY43467.1 MAG: peptidase S46 [Bacteroidetes bacterium GWF2_42_66]HBL76554.1 serine protease [Prolixibacteraceae bacterium]HCR91090.1 serine protease [Prolixibacteraceae bacterium]
MKRTLLIATFLMVSLIGKVTADEGMWLPALVQKLNMGTMQDMGLELSADDIYNINHSSLKDAVVSLDHGSCTGELVSPEGLLLTNHHCGFDEIQEHSTVEHDYLTDGFWAKTKEEELPNPGKTVSFLVRVEDVTEKVLAGLTDDMTEDQRDDKVREISSKIKEEAIGESHYEAQVKPMMNGNQFYLFVYETFRDIRLVGAPPSSIGKFGGDTDNWMWPRHTGDFSIFRVYCDKDGKPADYSKDNVPYQSKHHLPVSLAGVDKDDFTMVLGYPGRTNRYKTSYGVQYTMDATNAIRIIVREAKLNILKDYMATSPKARIQYASKYARSSNYYKFSIGQNKGLDDLDVIAKKKAIEDKFTTWVNQSEERKAKYGEALNLIKESYANVDDNVAYEYLIETMLQGPDIFYFAFSAKSLYEALKKENNEEHITASSSRMRSKLDGFFKDYDATTDRKVAAALLKIYNDKVAVRYHPEFFKIVNQKYKGDFNAYMADLFAKSVFVDQEKMGAFLDDPKLKTFEKDELFQISSQVFETFGKIGDLLEGGDAKLLKGNRLFLAGLMEMDRDRKFYPDANSTMRLTYGSVGDYKPRDAVFYRHYTTLQGYIEKEIPGDFEFDVPARLKELYKAKDFGPYVDQDGTLHTCFISNNDITGGNSGSPVINGKGQLVGIAFDGNWEAMSGDIAFENELQKCINVDIRFVLWTIDKYAGATNLIEEMTIVK